MKWVTTREMIGVLKRESADMDMDQLEALTADLGQIFAKHFGGQCATIPNLAEGPGNEGDFEIGFTHNEEVPEDGGVYAYLDTDVSVDDWKRENRLYDAP